MLEHSATSIWFTDRDHKLTKPPHSLYPSSRIRKPPSTTSPTLSPILKSPHEIPLPPSPKTSITPLLLPPKDLHRSTPRTPPTRSPAAPNSALPDLVRPISLSPLLRKRVAESEPDRGDSPEPSRPTRRVGEGSIGRVDRQEPTESGSCAGDRRSNRERTLIVVRPPTQNGRRALSAKDSWVLSGVRDLFAKDPLRAVGLTAFVSLFAVCLVFLFWYLPPPPPPMYSYSSSSSSTASAAGPGPSHPSASSHGRRNASSSRAPSIHRE